MAGTTPTGMSPTGTLSPASPPQSPVSNRPSSSHTIITPATVPMASDTVRRVPSLTIEISEDTPDAIQSTASSVATPTTPERTGPLTERSAYIRDLAAQEKASEQALHIPQPLISKTFRAGLLYGHQEHHDEAVRARQRGASFAEMQAAGKAAEEHAHRRVKALGTNPNRCNPFKELLSLVSRGRPEVRRAQRPQQSAHARRNWRRILTASLQRVTLCSPREREHREDVASTASGSASMVRSQAGGRWRRFAERLRAMVSPRSPQERPAAPR